MRTNGIILILLDHLHVHLNNNLMAVGLAKVDLVEMDLEEVDLEEVDLEEVDLEDLLSSQLIIKRLNSELNKE